MKFHDKNASQLYISVLDEQHTQLKILAKHKKKRVYEIVREAITMYLNQYKFVIEIQENPEGKKKYAEEKQQIIIRK